MKPFEILVIHRAQDERREKFVKNSFDKANLKFKFLHAVDGHDCAQLAPYKDLIGDDFWGKDEIKPGAIGCFLSHRKAWQYVVDNELTQAIIAEDDSRPVPSFRKKWPNFGYMMSTTDILFFNDRLTLLAGSRFEEIKNILPKIASTARFRAPGADGYALSANTAKRLIDLSAQTRIRCGVDWFLLAMCLGSDVPEKIENEEFTYILDRFGGLNAGLQAKVAPTPLFRLNRNFNSVISHKDRINIAELKKKLD